MRRGRVSQDTVGPGRLRRVGGKALLGLWLLLAMLLVATGVAEVAVANPALSPSGGAPAGAAQSLGSPAWPPTGLTAVFFVDADHGWLTATGDVADEGIPIGGNRVYVTSNGGATWTLQFDAPGLWYLFELRPFFISPRTGWAYGRSMMVTRDGGAHWRRSPIAPNCYWTQDLQWPGGVVLWAQTYYDPDSPFAQVRRSTDTGRSWKLVRVYRGAASLGVFSSRSAILAGHPQHWVSLTTDAGRTWKKVWRFPGDYMSAVVSRRSRSAWLWGDGGIAHTADGGRTWRRVSRFRPSLMACASASTCWAVRSDAVLRTLDGGVHWSSFTPPWAGTDDGIDSVQFIDARTGWVVEGGARVWRTLDGGASWSLVLSL